MDWVQIVATFGSTLLVLVAVGWFLLARVWPFVTGQIQRSQSERTREP